MDKAIYMYHLSAKQHHNKTDQWVTKRKIYTVWHEAEPTFQEVLWHKLGISKMELN